MYHTTSAKSPLYEKFEILGTAHAWLILFSRTKGSLRFVQLTGVLFSGLVLMVVIGKPRVKTQHNDDDCPQNDQ